MRLDDGALHELRGHDAPDELRRPDADAHDEQLLRPGPHAHAHDEQLLRPRPDAHAPARPHAHAPDELLRPNLLRAPAHARAHAHARPDAPSRSSPVCFCAHFIII